MGFILLLTLIMLGSKWIPSVYLMQGAPFALVTIVSAILYKDFGYTNTAIAFYTSLFTLPWAGKFLLAPAFENTEKRTLTLVAQFGIAFFILLLAFILYFSNEFLLVGALFLCIASAGVIHDMNSDGLYLTVLNSTQQTQLIGLRTFFYQLGKLFCQGIFVVIVGYFLLFNQRHIWSFAFFILSLAIFFLALFNASMIPNHESTTLRIKFHWSDLLKNYQIVFNEVRQLPHLIPVSIFILLYSLPEAQLMKMVPLFLLDSPQQGGLGLNVTEVGFIYGNLSIVSMLMGVTLSGFLLNRFTLKKCLVPFTIIAMLGNASYLLLTIFSPHSIFWLGGCVACAEFAFGLSNGAYLLYLMTCFARGRYAMSLYALATALMQLGITFSGSISGYLQSILSYRGFFIWIIIAGLGLTCLAFYHSEKIICKITPYPN